MNGDDLRALQAARYTECRAALLYPASDDAKSTTGTSLIVDGGWIAQ
jgi:NAD(P)-dependent dehydrogenase (short-subunit alcohol dehydrogenase family)